VVDVAIPGLAELLSDRYGGYLVIRQEFKFDLDAYLASRPTAPVRSLAEIVASKRYHPAVEERLYLSYDTPTLDTVEYREHLLKRKRVRVAVCQAMAEHGVAALLYPPIRRKAMPLGEDQPGTNCQLSASAGLPAISVPAGFTPDGLPVGLEILGREWDEPRLLQYAYAFENATRHRRPPASTPAL